MKPRLRSPCLAPARGYFVKRTSSNLLPVAVRLFGSGCHACAGSGLGLPPYRFRIYAPSVFGLGCVLRCTLFGFRLLSVCFPFGARLAGFWLLLCKGGRNNLPFPRRHSLKELCALSHIPLYASTLFFNYFLPHARQGVMTRLQYPLVFCRGCHRLPPACPVRPPTHAPPRHAPPCYPLPCPLLAPCGPCAPLPYPTPRPAPPTARHGPPTARGGAFKVPALNPPPPSESVCLFVCLSVCLPMGSPCLPHASPITTP